MSGIKFNQLTKEIELKGSESFIESHFSKIQDLLVESFGVKKMAVPREAKTNQKPETPLRMKEVQAVTEIKRREVYAPPQISTGSKSPIPAAPPTSRVSRPPVRKYIRREGMPGEQRMAVEVVGSKPSEISITALKEKFGLSDSKVGGIFRDAEKLGMVKRATDGSYVWSQD